MAERRRLAPSSSHRGALLGLVLALPSSVLAACGVYSTRTAGWNDLNAVGYTTGFTLTKQAACEASALSLATYQGSGWPGVVSGFVVNSGAGCEVGYVTPTSQTRTVAWVSSFATRTGGEGYTQLASTPKVCTAIKETNQSSPPLACSSQGAYGNPIHVLTGAKKDSIATGISLGGIDLLLRYDTTPRLPSNQGDAASSLTELNSFGALWKSSFHHKLQVAPGLRGALLARGDGTLINFEGNGAGGFSTAADNPHKLVSISGGYRFTDVASGALETYDSIGRLLSMAAANGVVLSFAYSGDNLVKVQSNEGRSLRFVYTNGLITRIIGPDWGTISTQYDARKNLSALTWADGKTFTLLYENPSLPWALTGKLDENGARFATYTYDAQGRAASTEHAGGVDKFTVAYETPPLRVVTDSLDPTATVLFRTIRWQNPTGINVTQPNGQSVALQAQLVAGVPLITSRSQPAGSGCAAALSGMGYDAAGNVVSRDDFQGVRTCYAYDAYRRETLRVEGLPNTASCAAVLPDNASLPEGARKISTSWHPDWGLATQTAQPLRKTSTVHHGQPDPFNGGAVASCSSAPTRADGKPLPLVCRQVEQAAQPSGALDPAVPDNGNRYTYDAAGRLLTSTDANGRSTSYAYYTDTTFTGATFDADIDKVSLLLHGNGLNASGTVRDDSALGQSVTVMGNAKISTAQSKFGGASLAFDGSGDYLTLPFSEDLNLQGADFTVEGHAYLNNAGTYQTLVDFRGGSAWNASWALAASTGSRALFLYDGVANSTLLSTGSNAFNFGTWFHWAVTRTGGVVTFWIDGVNKGSRSYNLPATHVSGIRIGANQASADGLSGFIDELRITKGKARYTASFAPPAEESSHIGPGMAATGHRVGDLQSITNPAGHVTQFTRYDPAGRLRQMIDAKGVVTDFTYTPRGWASTVTTTPPGAPARSTRYSYDSVGQITAVTLPDATTLSYSYDDAHRLIGTTDAQGNAVRYTLDNAGNRVTEELRDPSGNLQRSISRSFDALNRLQQVSGASQ